LAELEIPIDKGATKRFVLLKRHYPRDIRHHLTAITVRQITEHPEITKKNFLIVPGITLLSEHERDVEANEDWQQTNKSELSLDLGYKPTPSFGFWATLNPNFLEVEADLTDFSINDPFTPLDIVYTRNIEDPIGGFNASGSVGKLTTGNFVVYDRETSLKTDIG